MLTRGLKLFGYSTLFGGIVVGGNYLFVQDDWKRNHALIKESINLLEKDAKVKKILGRSLARKGKVQGTLEPEKNWASAAFVVYGSEGEAKVHILAEAKEGDESGEFPVKEIASPTTTLDYIIKIFNPAYFNKETFYWKITSMHVKFDDVSNYPIIHDKLRSHKEMRELNEIDSDSDKSTAGVVDVLPQSYKSRVDKRRMERSRIVWYRALEVGGVCAVIAILVWFFGKKYLKILPVANSVFFGTTLQTLKYEPIIQKEIGVPMNFLQNVRGRTDASFTYGNAEFTVYGPNGFGKVHAEGEYEKKKLRWKYTKLTLLKGDKEYSMLKE